MNPVRDYACSILTCLKVRKVVVFIPDIQMTYGNASKSTIVVRALILPNEVHIN